MFNGELNSKQIIHKEEDQLIAILPSVISSKSQEINRE